MLPNIGGNLMAFYELKIDGEEKSLNIKSFFIISGFSINTQTKVQAHEPYCAIHFSEKSDGKPFSKPLLTAGDTLEITGNDEVKIQINDITPLDYLKWEFRNEVHHLYSTRIGRAGTSPESWIKFEGNKPMQGATGKAEQNIPTITHFINKRGAYAVYERENDNGCTSLGFVLPIAPEPLLLDISKAARANFMPTAPAFPKLTVERKIEPGNLASKCVSSNITSTFFEEAPGAVQNAEGYVIIAQGNFKTLPLNHKTLMDWLDFNNQMDHEKFLQHISELAQNKFLRTLETSQIDNVYSVSQESQSLPVELLFIDNVRRNSPNRLEPYI